jgi:Glycosyl hydrolases family 28
MIVSKSYGYFSGIFIVIFFTLIYNIPAQIVAYPAPPGLITSTDFTVQVNGMPVWVERTGSRLKSFSYPLYYGSRAMEDLNVANFSGSGRMTIKIKAPANITSYVIRPKSRNIKAVVSGRNITFNIPGPQKLYIEINGLPHLAIFANPPEATPPKKDDSAVIYYGPGSYNPGQINLKSNQTIYIEKGAIVNAEIKGENLHNVKIKGQGILQGTITISGTSNLEVSDIFMRNTKGWTNTLTNCHHSSYRNVKIFSYEAIYSADGIDPVSCTSFIIDDCFMRCRDDCVSIKSLNGDLKTDSIFVMNSVMVGWSCADGVTLGMELNGNTVENVLVKNCDILYARSDGATHGHSGFSIVCDGPAWVQNICFEDIRVEENIEFKNLELVVTNGTYYGADPPGHIRDIYFKNIQWENPDKPFIISGYSSANTIEGITFDHCKVAGKLLTGITDADFRVNAYVSKIKFIP